MKVAMSINFMNSKSCQKTSHLTFFLLFFPNLLQAKLLCHFSLLCFPLKNTNSNHTSVALLPIVVLNGVHQPYKSKETSQLFCRN